MLMMVMIRILMILVRLVEWWSLWTPILQGLFARLVTLRFRLLFGKDGGKVLGNNDGLGRIPGKLGLWWKRRLLYFGISSLGDFLWVPSSPSVAGKH
jgi:hypothetical protein